MSSIQALLSELNTQKRERELEKKENERKEEERMEREEFEKGERRREDDKREEERNEKERVMEKERKEHWEKKCQVLHEGFERLDVKFDRAIMSVKDRVEEQFDSLQTRVGQQESCIPSSVMPSSHQIGISLESSGFMDCPPREVPKHGTADRNMPHRHNRSMPQRHRDESESPERRKRSNSPTVPRMQSFSGHSKGLRFAVFKKRFLQIAERRGWDEEKQYYRFLDCLTDQALDYALSVSESESLPELLAAMAVRFDFREEPVTARQKLAVLRQDSETEEEFLQKVQRLAHDGYPSDIGHGLVTGIITEAFLCGIRNKRAALYAVGCNSTNAQEALQLVKSFTAHAKAFGVGKQDSVKS